MCFFSSTGEHILGNFAYENTWFMIAFDRNPWGNRLLLQHENFTKAKKALRVISKYTIGIRNAWEVSLLVTINLEHHHTITSIEASAILHNLVIAEGDRLKDRCRQFLAHRQFKLSSIPFR